MLNTLNDKTGDKLVRAVVFNHFGRYATHWAEIDDLLGYGYLGLARALKQYDISKGITFVSFAYRKALQAIIEYVRLDSAQNALKTLSFAGFDQFYITDDVAERVDFVEQLRNCLTTEEQEIIHRTYWQEESEREIAEALKVSKTSVHLTKTYALQKMRDKGNFLLKKGGCN